MVPTELGGCKVLGTARAEPGSARTWGAQHVTGEFANPPIRYLAIAQDDQDRFFLFSCDEHWNVIFDSLCYSIEEALTEARYQFDDLRFAGLDELS